MYVCMYVCMYVRTYVCMYVFMYVRITHAPRARDGGPQCGACVGDGAGVAARPDAPMGDGDGADGPVLAVDGRGATGVAELELVSDARRDAELMTFSPTYLVKLQCSRGGCRACLCGCKWGRKNVSHARSDVCSHLLLLFPQGTRDASNRAQDCDTL